MKISTLGSLARERVLFALLASAALLACGDDGDTSPGGSGGAGASGGGTGAASGGTGAAGGGTGAAGGGTGAAGGGQGGSGGHLPADIVEPGDPGQGDVTFTVRVDQGMRPISPLIYGANWAEDLDGDQRGTSVVRMGGNRMTAYNWENNASNAGSDYMFQNDAHLAGNSPNGDVPGEAVRMLAEDALSHGAAFIATIPICGYVAADKAGDGDVNKTPNYLQTRFHPTIARKGAPFSAAPNLGDNAVYQDEFVAWMKQAFPDAFQGEVAKVLFSLDNEPDLWNHTHERIHPEPVTYAELVEKNIEFASAVKDVAPNALVTGFVSYGYSGYVSLQGAPDADGNFIEHYLDAMKAAEASAGHRLVDVLDLHWYTEIYANGERITGDDASPESVEARVQAPRSLWDPTFKEDSWIANDVLNGPIKLIPWLRGLIDAHYPGTEIGFTEYNYGGGNHISGAIAQADALGVFGREGVFLATIWDPGEEVSMLRAGVRAFTSYDGKGARFGDTSIHAETSDVAKATVYASIDEADPSRMVLVAINKTAAPLTAAVTLAAYASYTAVDVWRLTAAKADLVAADAVTPGATNAFTYAMPAHSVSVLVPR
ncbi:MULTISPECIES: glycoside hydrolase family 44 protein [Sorangium]|uniref:Endoglucanase n=1 Tax=Sorangium cellulosum TaxID=56 RepID=A0A4P2QQ42_SORCE|nr:MULTISPECIES: glycoside hydrolase family 44 protein [Sorangium]AUX32314.1 endoglucanase [Sorangium cellulosum]WCQ91688.1 Beta-mannanase/endoglucanase A [Sorangium sp. Soce836]